MTASQILVEVVIGLALIVIGVFARGPLERFLEFVKRPTPLTPQTRGQWVTYLATMEQSLARINYLNAHPRDLYLYLFQLVFACIALFGLSFILVILVYETPASPQPHALWLAFSIVGLIFGVILATLGIFEGIGSRKNESTRRVRSFKNRLIKPSDFSTNPRHDPRQAPRPAAASA